MNTRGFSRLRRIFTHGSDNVSIKDRERCCGFTHSGGAVAGVISEIRPLGDPRRP